MKWEPIETAPKDGRELLLYPSLFVTRVYDVGWWDADKHAATPRPRWSRHGRAAKWVQRQPTHYIDIEAHLPPLPEEGT